MLYKLNSADSSRAWRIAARGARFMAIVQSLSTPRIARRIPSSELFCAAATLRNRP